MNKKLIRLTESDLHKIVKESVNKVLTELDWKTYASAADKLRQRELDNGRASIHDKDEDEQFKGTWFDDDEVEDRIYNLQNASAKAFNKKHGLDNKQHLTFDMFTNKPHLYGDYHGGYDIDRDELEGNDYPKAAKDDLRNFHSGKSKYIKGHGYIEY